MNKVVITGIGMVTPLGFGREKSWRNLLESKSGIKRDPGNGGLLCARVDDFSVPHETRLLSMAFLAAGEAILDSGINSTEIDASRYGCTVSVSKPNIAAINNNIDILGLYSPSALGTQLYKIFKLRGPLQNIKAACATGTNSIILAAEWIKHGICDIVLAGAVESPFHPLYQAGFAQMGVLASKMVCPFDKKREGFAPGEGAGIFVLERKDLALIRGARIYGELSGWAMANDATHPVAFDPAGAVIASSIKKALKQSGLDTVDYVNAHGTATLVNDLVETRAIKRAFERKSKLLSISSTKASTGHLLGASGAVELGFSLLAMRDNVIPPTLNLTEPDAECDLDFTPNTARQKAVESAMSLSFGFGGQIGVIAVSK